MLFRSEYFAGMARQIEEAKEILAQAEQERAAAQQRQGTIALYQQQQESVERELNAMRAQLHDETNALVEYQAFAKATKGTLDRQMGEARTALEKVTADLDARRAEYQKLADERVAAEQARLDDECRTRLNHVEEIKAAERYGLEIVRKRAEQMRVQLEALCAIS